MLAAGMVPSVTLLVVNAVDFLEKFDEDDGGVKSGTESDRGTVVKHYPGNRFESRSIQSIEILNKPDIQRTNQVLWFPRCHQWRIKSNLYNWFSLGLIESMTTDQ